MNAINAEGKIIPIQVTNQASTPAGDRDVLKTGNEMRKAAVEYARDAVETLAKIMSDTNEPAAARVSASTQILDRSFGKAGNFIEGFRTDLGKMAIPDAIDALLEGVTNGEISLEHAEKLMGILDRKMAAVELDRMQTRMEELEQVLLKSGALARPLGQHPLANFTQQIIEGQKVS